MTGTRDAIEYAMTKLDNNNLLEVDRLKSDEARKILQGILDQQVDDESVKNTGGMLTDLIDLTIFG